MDTFVVVALTAMGTTFSVLVIAIVMDRKAFFPPYEDPPVLSELFDRLDHDVAAVIEDAQAIRRYGASKVQANGQSPTEGSESTLQVNAP
jgi:hypothetical protein